ncbi:hypothetical protein DLM86_31665 [Paenibacillus flagellatus]|uniref:Uncharacterized protein n=1 Tax=Paenibacillus flagellatus TaxID=2211139 RepID=A0A2V5JUB3_9BACL|nr:hypothetical protein DLM86_31665 [Paenibacillus flagellatus]
MMLSWTNTILPKIWSPFYVFNAQYFRNSGLFTFLKSTLSQSRIKSIELASILLLILSSLIFAVGIPSRMTTDPSIGSLTINAIKQDFQMAIGNWFKQA